MQRMLRRRSAWEGSPDLNELIRIEFRDRQSDGPDLHISAYDVRTEFPRLHAEHMAGCKMHPPSKANTHVDVSGLFMGVPRAEPGEVPFVFSRDAHRSLDFATVADLEEFVRNLLAQYTSRRAQVRWQDIRSYLSTRVRVANQEWMDVLAEQVAWTEWVRI